MDDVAKDEESMDVKSTAVVKFAGIPTPSYQKLQINTDLNAPPANWLQGSSKWQRYMRNVSLGRPANGGGGLARGSFLSQLNGPEESAAAATARQTAAHSTTAHSAQQFISNSFHMANCFPDLASEIDVISDAENMKRLLKMPYSSGQISMMVHRVDNTILLDDFDVHKHLLRQQQSDWQWLRKFYYDTVVQDMQQKMGDKYVLKKNKSRDHLQNRNMFSKFLYYSVAEGEGEDLHVAECCHSREHRLNTSSYQCMPDPLPKCEPDTTEHQRSVLWQFEDIRMLIGSDLPIFGGSTHPCVSLRLRDMCKPITVLTGLDYWLDNLMCNVPELAMCYHLNGIVQNYEILKTEDLPSWQDSQFSPQVIKDMAQNILSFLKTNATKEGHTYWLFKGQGDDVVKLYDLSTLCADRLTERSENPYTVPVGILLYRVARNMRQTRGRKKSGTIRALLDNCLLLLDPAHHSQVFTSAHYLLSDLYISDNIYEVDAEGESTDTSSEDDDQEEDNSDEANVQESTEAPEKQADCRNDDNICSHGDAHSSRSNSPENPEDPASTCCVAVAELSNQFKVNPATLEDGGSMSRHPSITGSTEQRCLQALKHIAEGLACLDKNIESGTSDDSSETPVTEPSTCNPSEAIPMHYQPLSSMQATANGEPVTSPTANQNLADSGSANQKRGARRSHRSGSEVTVYSKTMPTGSWHTQSKILLLRKAVICYYKLAEGHLQQRNFSLTLHYLALALQCFGTVNVLSNIKAKENTHLLIAVLALAGDAHLLMLADKGNHGNQTRREPLSENDETIHNSAACFSKGSEYAHLVEPCSDPESHLERSLEAFQQAVDLTEGGHLTAEHICLLMKRYGNVHNELGVHKMNKAAALINAAGAGGDSDTEPGQAAEQAMLLAMQSWKCLEQSLEAFTSVADTVNQALIHCNMGRLMRVCVQAQASDDLDRQKHYYRRAQENYQQALRLLPPGVSTSAMRESVQWELCSTYYFLACQLQDSGVTDPSAQQQVEKEVTDLMMKALKLCTVDAEGPQYRERSAAIHHRLASLYHNAYRKTQVSDVRKKQLRSLAELHYNKAGSLLEGLGQPCQMLRIQLERIALSEHQLEGVNSAASRLRLLQTTLTSQLLECKSALEQLQRHLQDADPDHQAEPDEEAATLLDIWQSRLDATLLDMVKNTTLPSGKRKTHHGSNTAAPAAKYKAMYSAALRRNTDSSTSLVTRCQHLLDLIVTIKKLNQSEESTASGSVT